MHSRLTLAILAAATCASLAAPAAARPYLMLFADDKGFQALDIGDFVRTPVSPYADDRILRPAPPPVAPKPTAAPAPAAKPTQPAQPAPLSLGEYDGLLAYPPPKPKPKLDPQNSALAAGGAAEPDGGTGCARNDANPRPRGLRSEVAATEGNRVSAATGDANRPLQGPRFAGTSTDADGVQSGSPSNDSQSCAQASDTRAALAGADGPRPETFAPSGPRLQDPRTQGVLGAGEGSARITPLAPPHPLFVPDRVEATLISAPLAGAPYGDKLAPMVKQRVEFDCHEPRWRMLSRAYTDAHEVLLGTAAVTQEWQDFGDDPAASLAQAALCKHQFRQAAVSRFLNVGEILANYQAAHGAGVPQPKTREQLLAEHFKNSH